MATATEYGIIAGVLSAGIIVTVLGVGHQTKMIPSPEDWACSQPTNSGYPRKVAWVAVGQKSRYVQCAEGKYIGETK